MAFITPIIDRTEQDVLYAMLNQNSTQDLKGAWNVSDINRLINNINHLKTELQKLGYNASITAQADFIESELPFASKLDIIRNNIKSIVNSFYKFNNPEIRYGDIFDYEDANTLEINLKITNDLLTSLLNELRYCGEGYCGESITL